jgi:hypothetical protein
MTLYVTGTTRVSIDQPIPSHLRVGFVYCEISELELPLELNCSTHSRESVLNWNFAVDIDRDCIFNCII